MIPEDVLKTQKISSINRIPQLTFARSAACFAIVALHTLFAANEYFLDTLTGNQNIVSRAIENNLMWAVPVFLMVTGVLHLDADRELTLRKLYGKYICRVFLALVIFSLLFRIFDMVMEGESFSVSGVLYAFTELLISKGWGHLWYLYLLIGLYILMPFYKIIAAESSDEELKYLAAVYVVFLSLIPLAESFGYKVGFYVCLSLIYPLYLFIGHMIYEKRIVISKTSAAIMAFVSTVCLVILSVIKYGKGIEVPGELLGYSSPLVIMQSLGLFAMIDANAGMIGARGIPEAIDRCSFGIYLIHMLFIRLVFKYMHMNPYISFSIVRISVCIVFFFLLSYIVTAALKHVPIFRKVL